MGLLRSCIAAVLSSSEPISHVGVEAVLNVFTMPVSDIIVTDWPTPGTGGCCAEDVCVEGAGCGTTGGDPCDDERCVVRV